MSTQLAADAAGRAGHASRDARKALVLLARHLRYEHGWGRRRVAKHFGWTETFVRDEVEDA